MRYHHACGCYSHGESHWGCGPGPVYGPGSRYGSGWDAPDEPRPYRRRERFGGTVGRRSTEAQLESYLASLRDEIRAVEQDLRDLAMPGDSGPGEDRV